MARLDIESYHITGHPLEGQAWSLETVTSFDGDRVPANRYLTGLGIFVPERESSDEFTVYYSLRPGWLLAFRGRKRIDVSPKIFETNDFKQWNKLSLDLQNPDYFLGNTDVGYAVSLHLVSDFDKNPKIAYRLPLPRPNHKI